MTLVAIVAGLALLEYATFVWQAGSARGRTGIPAPSMHGNEEFERRRRVLEKTIEQLVLFLPSIFLFAWFVSEGFAVALGLVFIVGRALYAHAYVTDPAKRGPGFLMTLGSNLVLLVGGLVGAIADWL